jgi:protein-S-isoprenylcysteine O-methyltransferase Ste14
MFARAVVAFLLLPGTVAFLIPIYLTRRDLASRAFHESAIAPLAVGTFLLLWCVRDFYVSGRGTLAPWSPPRHLVIVGLYRWSRNPMYISVGLILLGWAAAYRSTTLLNYAGIMMLVFYLRVVLIEEPWLARTHGEGWRHYQEHVPRWFV